MGENYTQLVDSRVSLADAPAEGARMLRWLQARGIVDAGIREGDLLSYETDNDDIAYRPGPNYREACEHDGPSTLMHNWLSVITERTVYHAGDSGIGIYCVKCNEEQTQHGEAYSDAIMDWWEQRPESLTCVGCGYRAPLSGWKFDPVFGFGNLGFSFHNWHLYPRFIEEFERELGRPVTVVIVHP